MDINLWIYICLSIYLFGINLSIYLGTDKGSGEPGWIVSKERPKWDKIFDTLNPHQVVFR